MKRTSGGSSKKAGSKKVGNKKSGSNKAGSNKAGSNKAAGAKAPGTRTKTAGGAPGSGATSGADQKGNGGSADSISNVRARTLLARPDSSGPRVTIGLGWFVAAVAAVFLGRWAVLALWGSMAALAAVQVGRAWAEQPKAAAMPRWAPALGATGAVLCVAASTIGTALGGVTLLACPILLVVAVTVAGRKPVSASGAVIGLVLGAIPAMSVVLVAREGWQPALFVVVAVSFYDAGYFIGAAESSSRLEGPVTGAIGLLAVTFAASAFEVAPFDRVTAWVAGAVMVLACPLGQMLVSAELPSPDSRVTAMRRLDSYLVSGPLVLAAVWALS